ncbi:MAG: helix-turn-helix domain-containing protein [Christensenellales bacterium]
MRFADVLKLYLDKTNCTAKELSAASGISASALSRYRSGKRIPEQEQVEKLICGFVQLASENAPELNEVIIRNAFSAYTERPKLDYQTIIKNLNAAIETLDISVSGLSRALSFDSSYLSRIRTGQRKPADSDKFIIETAGYIARTNSPSAIAELIGHPAEELIPVGRCASKLCSWLSSGTISQRDYLGELLHQLDAFNIEAYMSGTHFPKAVQVREPEILSLPKYYYGFDEMKKGELDFFRTVASSGTKGTVCMCNSIPIEDLSADAAYMREWMRAVAMMIVKGADIQIIHDVDRPPGEMLLGLMSWIPLYMTGKVTSFYLTDTSNRVYCHTDYVSDTAALSGECIRGYHDEGKYCLTQNEADLAYYKKRAQRLLSKAKPLMKTYRSENKAEFFSFEDSEVLSGGTRRNILSSLPTYTIPGDTLESLLENNSFGENDKADVKNYISRQKKMAETILENGTICDDFHVLNEEEFGKEPVYLSLSGIFSEKDLRYTYQEYLQHLAATKQFAADRAGYNLHTDAIPVFKNIQIQINAGKWVIVSKNNAPAIHFVIKHPRMIRAFEDLCKPLME